MAMNAAALLKSQGWRGQGHTLHATDDSTGLAKPLLIARKDNKLGIGTSAHKVATDQWWLNALDQQLKGLDTSTRGVVVQTLNHGQLNALVGSRAGKYKGAASLYTSFVRGGMLKGTLDMEDESTDATPEVEDRKPAVMPRVDETKEERRARREAKKLRKAEKAARKAGPTELEGQPDKDRSTETSEERRVKREERQVRKEQRQTRRIERRLRRERRQAKSQAKRGRKEDRERLKDQAG